MKGDSRPQRRQHRSYQLGVNAAISRRDFLKGVLLTGAGLLFHNKAPTISPEHAFNGYGGIGDYAHANGNTYDVINAGHAMRDGAFEKRIAKATDTGEIYDSLALLLLSQREIVGKRHVGKKQHAGLDDRLKPFRAICQHDRSLAMRGKVEDHDALIQASRALRRTNGFYRAPGAPVRPSDQPLAWRRRRLRHGPLTPLKEPLISTDA